MRFGVVVQTESEGADLEGWQGPDSEKNENRQKKDKKMKVLRSLF